MGLGDPWFKWGEWWTRTIENPVKIGIAIFIATFTIVAGITFQKPNLELKWFDNVLVESWGLVFDIAVVAVLLTWMNKLGADRRERKLNIQMQEDIIEDFRGWDSPEAAHRIRGAILRLNRMGVHEIDLYRCFLIEGDLMGAQLEKADLSHGHFEGAHLDEANLKRADLYNAYLQNAHLVRTNLEEADLSEAKFEGALLIQAHLKGAYFEGADFGTDLDEAFKQLSTVKTLYKTGGLDEIKYIGPELKARLEAEHPHLFEEPTEDEWRMIGNAF